MTNSSDVAFSLLFSIVFLTQLLNTFHWFKNNILKDFRNTTLISLKGDGTPGDYYVSYERSQ